MHDSEVELHHVADATTKARITDLLKDDEVSIVGLNISGFDLPVLLREYPDLAGLIAAKLRKKLVWDVGHVFRYLDLAQGKLHGEYDEDGKYVKSSYSLKALVERSFSDVIVAKEDTYRLRYHELLNVPLASWPTEAVAYAHNDAIYTAALWESFTSDELELARNVPAECRAEFYLALQSWEGLRTDVNAVTKYEQELLAEIASAEYLLKQHEIVRSNGTRDTKKAKAFVEKVAAYQGATLLLTDSGAISMSAKALRDLRHPVITAYSTFVSAKTTLTRAKLLYEGASGDNVLQTQYVIINNNGRTSSRSPTLPAVGNNFQNLPRKGKLRECFIPKIH